MPGVANFAEIIKIVKHVYSNIIYRLKKKQKKV